MPSFTVGTIHVDITSDSNQQEIQKQVTLFLQGAGVTHVTVQATKKLATNSNAELPAFLSFGVQKMGLGSLNTTQPTINKSTTNEAQWNTTETTFATSTPAPGFDPQSYKSNDNTEAETTSTHPHPNKKESTGTGSSSDDLREEDILELDNI